jgi:hypothetical protein
MSFKRTSERTRITLISGIGNIAGIAGIAALLALAGCSRGGNESHPAAPPIKQASGPSGPPAAAAPGSQDLSDEAKEITFVTRRAAMRGNLVALHKQLGDDYRWSGPDQQTADHLTGVQAIEKWREHPELLKDLMAIVDKGCRPDGTEHVVCPPEALTDTGYKGYAAGYTHQKTGDWKMTSFENRG